MAGPGRYSEKARKATIFTPAQRVSPTPRALSGVSPKNICRPANANGNVDGRNNKHYLLHDALLFAIVVSRKHAYFFGNTAIWKLCLICRWAATLGVGIRGAIVVGINRGFTACRG